MKNILLIGAKEAGDKNNVDTIRSQIHIDELNVEVVYWEDIVVDITSNNVSVWSNGKDVLAAKPALVMMFGWYKNGAKSYYRDVAFAVAMYMKSKNIPVWNSEVLSQRSTTKLSCLVQLALEGCRVPDTRYSMNHKELIANVKLPFVAKAVAASRGENNHLIRSADSIDRAFANDIQWIIQPFLPNDHDLRVICFGGEPRFVLKRSRAADAKTHLNNTSQGGTSEAIDIKNIRSELLTESRKICKIMKREMAGIDFIPDGNSPNGYSCLEVNAIPQLTSGHDVEGKMRMLYQSIMEGMAA